jgi:ABC-type multidrug transport system ATPase subunit
MLINDKGQQPENSKYIRTEKLNGDIFILRISSVDLYFLKYTGNEDLFLNGMGISNKRIYLFATGSTVKLPKGKPIYYSDIVSHYLADITSSKISFEVNNLEYRFPNGNTGLRNISFSEGHGKLIGIMGASGAGKTTLLNVLCGTESPYSGSVEINGCNLHTQKEKLEGVIGLIPQDDLLIEELTVFENLYYNAKLCFRDRSEEEITGMVHRTLSSLGLLERKDLKVGSPLNKTISGGQRKRLNIALELIREPSILFVDEPTSGLSSRDSENVMDLLRELALKGKLIFVVIHQPSSEIYKMFDKMIILDTGGYMVYYGNPVEAVMYFKRIDAQINSEVGECPTCGNVNPELIFNIVEAKVVDEFGRYTTKRKVAPTKWEDHYHANIIPEKVPVISEEPPKSLSIPNWFKQFGIYTLRDFFSKISNKQYIALNLLEAPLLGLMLSYIIRYISEPNSDIYIFRENENMPIYIFMSLIVALFMGLMVSAEEIFRDRKILKREAFLNLSRSSYLVSKITILFTISAIQTITFVLIANTILGIKGMTFEYWLALFSTAAFANMLGLNISATFNSAVTIYIIIPLVMIPMMVLSGAMFSFDKLNRTVGSVDKVPLLAEIMVTKWSYEALVVHQFKNNEFEKLFYTFEKRVSIADFKQVHIHGELMKRYEACISELDKNGKITENVQKLLLIRNEVEKEGRLNPRLKFRHSEKLTPEAFTIETAGELGEYLDNYKEFYSMVFQENNAKKEDMVEKALTNNPVLYNQLKNDYHNEAISDLAKKVLEKKKILEYNNQLVQQIDPIFMDPAATSMFTMRSHFLAPRKFFMGSYYDTFYYNMIVIWFFTLLLYITLYYELIKKLFDLLGKISFNKEKNP